MSKTKIKATITEVVIANRMVRAMRDYGLTTYDMIRVIELAREKFNNYE